jgi:dUTP pyrophosphatase
MTVLSKKDIKQLLDAKPPLLESYLNLEEQIQPNGFDLTLKDIKVLKSTGKMGVDNKYRVISKCDDILFDKSEEIELLPGAYLVTLNEIVNIPDNITAFGKTRSSLLRCGVAIHNAVWDAGYSGRSQALMIVYNPHGFRIQRNARVLQLVFLKLTDKTQGYTGIYQRENI